MTYYQTQQVMTDYFVVKAATPDGLKAQVVELSQKGWVPLGGVACGNAFYYQSMAKYGPPPVEARTSGDCIGITGDVWRVGPLPKSVDTVEPVLAAELVKTMKWLAERVDTMEKQLSDARATFSRVFK